MGAVCRGNLLLLCLAVVLAAQPDPLPDPQNAGPTSSPPSPEFTLHAYANLIQIPVLVLGPGRERLARPIPPERFSLSIDAGPWFRATHVRREGNDPLALSILLDTHNSSSVLIPGINDALAGLAPALLLPADHVTVYALDCGLVRAGSDMAAHPSMLREQVDAALGAWHTRTGSHERCPNAPHLQEAMLHILNAMSELPGRRVLLVVTASERENGRVPWREVAEMAESNGIAIFAVAPQQPVLQIRSVRFPIPEEINALDVVCQHSGGTLLSSSASDLPRTFETLTHMIRERYIVEFPPASNSTAGRHSFEVRIDKTSALIRPSGISVPMPDPELEKDPATVHSDPSLAPIQGDRRPMK